MKIDKKFAWDLSKLNQDELQVFGSWLNDNKSLHQGDLSNIKWLSDNVRRYKYINFNKIYPNGDGIWTFDKSEKPIKDAKVLFKDYVITFCVRKKGDYGSLGIPSIEYSSECGINYYVDTLTSKFNYCPNCGKKIKRL